jgi:type IV secretory pathway VirB10-like protein
MSTMLVNTATGETTVLSNAPSEPAVLFAECVDDLLLEARNFLDGEPITNEQQAEAVSSLLNRLRRVSKDADEARKVEKKPHDDAAKAVQAKWSPIISKAELAASTAKQALAPYLRAIEEQQQREAEAARKEAERLAEIARAAHQTASGNLEAQEDAERLLKAAAGAEKHAAKVGKQKARATGGERAVGLRSVWTSTLTDSCAALKHYRAAKPEDLKSWLTEQAERDVRGGAREIPGFTITEERKAV